MTGPFEHFYFLFFSVTILLYNPSVLILMFKAKFFSEKKKYIKPFWHIKPECLLSRKSPLCLISYRIFSQRFWWSLKCSCGNVWRVFVFLLLMLNFHLGSLSLKLFLPSQILAIDSCKWGIRDFGGYFLLPNFPPWEPNNKNVNGSWP